VLGGVEPGAATDTGRADLAAAVERIEAAARDADELVVEVGGEAVVLPAPGSVRAAVADGVLGDGDVTVELRWARAPERGSEKGGVDGEDESGEEGSPP
jgi:hypothetical protein